MERALIYACSLSSKYHNLFGHGTWRVRFERNRAKERPGILLEYGKVGLNHNTKWIVKLVAVMVVIFEKCFTRFGLTVVVIIIKVGFTVTWIAVVSVVFKYGFAVTCFAVVVIIFEYGFAVTRITVMVVIFDHSFTVTCFAVVVIIFDHSFTIACIPHSICDSFTDQRICSACNNE